MLYSSVTRSSVWAALIAACLFQRGSAQVSEYDFVIVGGGTAGLTLANRLSESGDQTVLVLEAGDEPTIVSSYMVPGSNQDVLGSQIDWSLVTGPERTMNDRTITYHQGRCLGGSSAINGMTYARGSSGIYDLWQSLGNDGWSWENVFPFFKKSTTFVQPPPPSENNNVSYTGFDASLYSDGPLQINYANYTTPASGAFIEAMRAIEVYPVGELNGGINLGAKQEPFTIDATQRRSSAYDSFYKEAKSRSNLVVRTSSPVRRIILNQNGSTTVASGVVYIDNRSGNILNATAKKEVILSAGTFHSPQILMLSGIGPAPVLEENAIQLYVNNENVGQGLYDHTYYSLYVRADPETSLTALFNNIYNLQQASQEFTQNEAGPLTAPTGPTYAFEMLSDQNLQALGASELIGARSNQAHVEYLYEPFFYPHLPTPQYGLGRIGESYISLTAGLVAPTSRGNVSIRSDSISDAPVINLRYFETTADQKIAVQSFKNLRKILADPALAPWVVGPDHGEVAPGPSVQSDEDILNYIRNVALPIWHVSGTCAMLPQASGGVVDNRLRLYGVQGLRVVDASIMPVIPDTHVQGPVYMVAEKAAHMIREDWGF
ncbi:hypothetical protein LTS08_008750 [Lithohypha guttulata]|uniref:Glucose-methanol-choline oxidoreductase N-terminal domain-containing protein n=1 Tax=Lithohypha guttulata TaxID=1690604 RepID=A0AAN7PRY8_9EURO|nr:hypothetical protein LTR51_008812 [Lithohypha guttulata]KAK5080096.1 hypothetical protein LTR05_008807 [Lithohypha guttulata]KAK5094091.1 hypothetical protein LTS08_008750 [Lithohypha guttulata]